MRVTLAATQHLAGMCPRPGFGRADREWREDGGESHWDTKKKRAAGEANVREHVLWLVAHPWCHTTPPVSTACPTHTRVLRTEPSLVPSHAAGRATSPSPQTHSR